MSLRPTRERTTLRFHFALLTPPGRGAVATIALWGAGAAPAVARYFTPANRCVGALPMNRIVFGTWRRKEDAGEELVVCRTGKEAFEIHCHGGDAAAAAIADDLKQAGGEQTGWEAWVRARRGGRESLAEIVAGDGNAAPAKDSRPLFAADALVALAEAKTERTAAILLDQYRGALADEIEAALSARDIAALERLRDRYYYGCHLTAPFRVVLAGPPNVGKSSLINALLGYERSIVYDQPGTTRDVVSAVTALEGWLFSLSDTAGLRGSEDALESAGIARAEQELAQADLIVWVSDFRAIQPLTPGPLPRGGARGVKQSQLFVLNKADLLRDEERKRWQSEVVDDSRPLLVSALTGEGLNELRRAIVSMLLPEPPAPGEGVPFLPGHLTLLDDLRAGASR